MAVLEIKDLCVSRDGKEILKGVNLKTGPDEVHAIMGPNGSGKSPLAYPLLGNRNYQLLKAVIYLAEVIILVLKTDKSPGRAYF